MLPIKKTITFLLLTMLAVAFLMPVAGAGPILYLEHDRDWEPADRGAWEQRADSRGLLAMRHPWEPAAQGDFAMTTRRLRIPSQWQGPVHLSFYCSDDVEGPEEHPLRKHRYKQVLVNDKVVWEADVMDAIPEGTPGRQRVTLEVQPGEAVRLALLVYDRDGTLPPREATSSENEPAPFMTHVYWGDIALEDGAALAQPGRRPVVAEVYERHRERWPLPEFGSGWKEERVRMTVAAASPLPAGGVPVRVGIPFPQGKVSEVRDVRLQTIREHALYSEKAVLSRWPDGSLRWVQFDFWADPDWEAVDLAFRRDWAEATRSLKVDEAENEVTVQSGNTKHMLQLGDVAATLGGPLNVVLQGHIRIRDNLVPATGLRFRVLEDGPGMAEIAIDGQFNVEEEAPLPFSLYLRFHAGKPLVQCWWRVVNDTAKAIPVSGLQLTLRGDRPYAALRMPGVAETPDGPVELRQTDARRGLLNGAPVTVDGPVFAVWEDLCVIPRHFDARHPSGLSARPGALTVDFIAGGNNPVVLTPGEASSHTLWIAQGVKDPAVLARQVAAPPTLAAPAYVCATGVLGPAAPWPMSDLSPTSELWRDEAVSTGVRHYPDVPYLNRAGEWCNNYYARALGFWGAWATTGQHVWYVRAHDTGEHLLDVAVVHGEVPGEDWQGALHGPGANHVAPPWPPTLRLAGLELHQKFTGQPEALEAVLAAADYCARTRPGIEYVGHGSVRYLAGPLDSLCTGYWETGETGFLDAGAAYVSAAKARLDDRRGVWNDLHGDVINQGTIPWMAGQLARSSYLWYRLTGDVEAAQVLVALADAVVSENIDWDAPGQLRAYSYHPKYSASAAYYPQVLPMFFAAHELSGADRFEEAARAVWATWASSEHFPDDRITTDQAANTLWMLPWLAHWGQTYGLFSSPDDAAE